MATKTPAERMEALAEQIKKLTEVDSKLVKIEEKRFKQVVKTQKTLREYDNLGAQLKDSLLSPLKSLASSIPAPLRILGKMAIAPIRKRMLQSSLDRQAAAVEGAAGAVPPTPSGTSAAFAEARGKEMAEKGFYKGSIAAATSMVPGLGMIGERWENKEGIRGKLSGYMGFTTGAQKTTGGVEGGPGGGLGGVLGGSDADDIVTRLIAIRGTLLGMASDLSVLATAGAKEGSIFVHDASVEEKLEEIDENTEPPKVSTAKLREKELETKTPKGIIPKILEDKKSKWSWDKLKGILLQLAAAVGAFAILTNLDKIKNFWDGPEWLPDWMTKPISELNPEWGDFIPDPLERFWKGENADGTSFLPTWMSKPVGELWGELNTKLSNFWQGKDKDGNSFLPKWVDDTIGPMWGNFSKRLSNFWQGKDINGKSFLPDWLRNPGGQEKPISGSGYQQFDEGAEEGGSDVDLRKMKQEYGSYYTGGEFGRKGILGTAGQLKGDQTNFLTRKKEVTEGAGPHHGSTAAEEGKDWYIDENGKLTIIIRTPKGPVRRAPPIVTRQHGGPIGSAQWGLVGEAGPEIIKGPGTVIPLKDTIMNAAMSRSPLAPLKVLSQIIVAAERGGLLPVGFVNVPGQPEYGRGVEEGNVQETNRTGFGRNYLNRYGRVIDQEMMSIFASTHGGPAEWKDPNLKYLAKGGKLAAGQKGIVGEQGPELLTGGGMGRFSNQAARKSGEMWGSHGTFLGMDSQYPTGMTIQDETDMLRLGNERNLDQLAKSRTGWQDFLGGMAMPAELGYAVSRSAFDPTNISKMAQAYYQSDLTGGTIAGRRHGTEGMKHSIAAGKGLQSTIATGRKAGGRDTATGTGLSDSQLQFLEVLSEFAIDFGSMKDIPNARVRQLGKLQDAAAMPSGVITGNNKAAVTLLNDLRAGLKMIGQGESRSSDAMISQSTTSTNSNMTNVNISNTGPNWAVSRDGAPGRLPNINPGYIGTRA